MSYGTLAGVLVWTLVTLAAWAPPRRPRLLARLGYAAGMVVNEVPLLAVVALLSCTLPAVARG
jgi:hypothetical protein